MEPAKIGENLEVLLGEIARKRPSDVKGDFVQSVYVASSMGPGVRVAAGKSER